MGLTKAQKAAKEAAAAEKSASENVGMDVPAENKNAKVYSVSEIAEMLTDGYEDSENIARKVLAKDLSAGITKEEIIQVMAHGLNHYCAFVSTGLNEINSLVSDPVDRNIDSLFGIVKNQFSVE